jgi:hypothetical protein
VSPSHIRYQERAKWAYSLRQQGKSFRQIAEWFGKPGTSYARDLVERGRRIRQAEAAELQP